MKKIKIIGLLLAVLFIGFSCKKSDNSPTTNSFSFQGKTYPITNSAVGRVILSLNSRELHVYQFLFGDVTQTDTTEMLIAVYDTVTNVLDGTYNAINQNDTVATRGIIPFGFVVASGIVLPNKDQYLTGAGGNIQVALSPGATDTTYTIHFNSISAGQYNGDMTQYTEAGKISGYFKGTMLMEQINLTSLPPGQGKLLFRKMLPNGNLMEVTVRQSLQLKE